MDICFAYWISNVNGELMVSKIPQLLKSLYLYRINPLNSQGQNRPYRNLITIIIDVMRVPIPYMIMSVRKYYAVSNYFLNNINPPRHPWL